ncbi:MAG: prephenate dehydrogenase/arogenate dehydrogenase family protein [Actinomycetota bacterium]
MRVALLGTGLIGGSIGLALRSLSDVEEVVAYDRDPEVRSVAVERGAAHRSADSPAEAVRDADFIFVATPVGTIPEVIAAARVGLKPGSVLTDVGSTKSRLVLEVGALKVEGATFIGGHPMAGTEEEGIGAADPALFQGCWWILTPTESVDADAYRALHSLITRLGAQVMAVDPAQHDDLLAVISHLPHLTAATLMNLAAERGEEHAGLLSLAAGGFRDVTRVAASNPDIWLDICAENAAAIADVLREFAGRLEALGGLVEAGAREELRERFLAARSARRELPGRRAGGDSVEVLIPVPDRPGVLAEVTTSVGNLGINIEDLQITHSEEGGRGTLRLIISGVDEAHRVQGALSAKGYDVRLTSL